VLENERKALLGLAEALKNNPSKAITDRAAQVIELFVEKLVKRAGDPPSTIHGQVHEFMKAFQPEMLQDKPCIPSDEIVRLRVKLVFEEAFEMMQAALVVDGENCEGLFFANAKSRVKDLITHAPVKVKLAEFVDATLDLDYVSEGARISFGVHGAPIAAEVHRSNMSKIGGHKAPDGKWIKPDTYSPADIVGELRKQGWEGP
jgi:predicted HAD superfamily Cof-like phosphohydrolase